MSSTQSVAGSKKSSLPHIVFTSNRVMCQKGQVDNFVFRTKHSLGKITHVKLWHDNYGNSPEW